MQNSSIVDDTIPRRKTSGTISFTAIVLINITIAPEPYIGRNGPCKMLGPVLEQVAAKVDDVQIVKINVDEESSVAEKYNIMSIPTLLLFKNGECVAKSVGFISEGQVMEFIGK